MVSSHSANEPSKNEFFRSSSWPQSLCNHMHKFESTSTLGKVPFSLLCTHPQRCIALSFFILPLLISCTCTTMRNLSLFSTFIFLSLSYFSFIFPPAQNDDEKWDHGARKIGGLKNKKKERERGWENEKTRVEGTTQSLLKALNALKSYE